MGSSPSKDIMFNLRLMVLSFYKKTPAIAILNKTARLAQLVERKTFNLVVVGSSPTAGTRLYK